MGEGYSSFNFLSFTSFYSNKWLSELDQVDRSCILFCGPPMNPDWFFWVASDADKFDKLHWVRISNCFRSYLHFSNFVTPFYSTWELIYQPHFENLPRYIFSCFEFVSELNLQNTGLLGIAVGDLNDIYGLAFNLGNLWESRPKLKSGQWRGAKERWQYQSCVLEMWGMNILKSDAKNILILV